ncbi:hypothetical protein MMC10_010819 [Thelotrema lepadinum]|nr:hypothetical protein [Thelotrema lepadinum]
MRFTSLTLLSTLLSLAAAQSGIPTCAQSCVVLPDSCNLDVKCICGDSSFISNISCCVSQKCSLADQTAALQYAQQLCASGGVSITQTAASCAATSGATSSGSAAPASTGSGRANSTTATGTMSMAGASSAASASAVSTAGAATGVEIGTGWLVGGLLGLAGML